jgi:fatty-acyl-CoA synthase
MTADDNVYVSMPMFHSACVMAAWAPCVATGATMSLRRRFSASGFLPDVRRLGVTYFHYVGKPLSYILATPQAPDDHNNPLRLANGNEAAEADIARFAERFGCTVIDAFGSTEGGVAVTRSSDTPQGSLGPLPANAAILDPDTGEPVATAVFDSSGRLTNPQAAIGELVNTTGAGAFEGYYNDIDADEDRMRGGMYWSGDLAYRDVDGFVYFAGRSIEWLRVDGENFTAAPVERVLSRHAPVALIAVYAVPGVDVGDEVMATIVVHDGSSFDPQRFTGFLVEQGDFGTKWVPRFVRVTRELPQTATNKVQKRVLASEAWLTDDPVWWLPDRRPPHHYELMSPDDKTSLAEVLRGNGRGHLLHSITAPSSGQKDASQ